MSPPARSVCPCCACSATPLPPPHTHTHCAALDFEQFREFLPQMKALDRYWETTSKDRDTGLFQWHDQLESGCDNLITSECPSTLGTGPPANEPCWVRVHPGGCTCSVLAGPWRAALDPLIHFSRTCCSAGRVERGEGSGVGWG